MYSVGGKTVSVENKFPEKKVNTLTFQVSSPQFPDHFLGINDGRNYVVFDSSEPNSVTVSWGDGVVETFDFGTDGLADPYRIGWTSNGEISTAGGGGAVLGDCLAGRHIYQDGNEGLRTITLTFRDLSKIKSTIFSFSRLYGQFPLEIGSAVDLLKIELDRTNFLTGLPETLVNNRNIEQFLFSDSFVSPLKKIPDGIFENKVTNLRGAKSFDLSDRISSNFFKINNLSTTLINLNLDDCLINMLPNSLSQCTLLQDLRIIRNPIKNPQVLETLFNLDRLYIDCDFFENGLFETTLLTGLRSFWSGNLTESLILDIPLKWTGLKALSSFVLFRQVISTNPLFQTFIENFYTLCTQNGFLDPSSTEAQNTGFPEQFRDISWGDGNDWFTVTNPIQAPSGFSLGISNGTPANNAEKIYVLVENYGHSVELSS
jgi:hypothetical protein